MIEITPNSSDHNINIFLSYESIPTYRSFMFHTKVEDLPISDTFGNEYKQNTFLKLSFQDSTTGFLITMLCRIKQGDGSLV